MDNGIEPGDSISQISKERSHVSVTSRTTHSTSSYGSGRSKEQLDLDISKLAIKMSSQEKKAQLQRNKLELEKRKLEVDLELEKRKLEVDLDIEKTDLKEQMDIAKVEREAIEESSSSVEENRPSEAEIKKMLSDDGARLARLIHLCKGEAGRAIRCCSLMDPELGYARARRILEQRFGDRHTITELWIKRLNDGGQRVNL